MKKTKKSLVSYELELYKQLYEEQFSFREKYSSRVFATISVVVSMIGALIWLLARFAKIYNSQCCYLRCLNIILLFCCCIFLGVVAFGIYKVLHYEETRPEPQAALDLVEGYKKQAKDENEIILAVNESLLQSYIAAAVKCYDENQDHMDKFIVVLKYILIAVVFFFATFLIEIFC
jgi:hypothetical protein